MRDKAETGVSDLSMVLNLMKDFLGRLRGFALMATVSATPRLIVVREEGLARKSASSTPRC